MSTPKVIRVYRSGQGERVGVLGTASKKVDGWRFTPSVSGRKPSRNAWPTWEASLPAWVYYPHGCETEVVR